jgi:VWFA-related protein
LLWPLQSKNGRLPRGSIPFRLDLNHPPPNTLKHGGWEPAGLHNLALRKIQRIEMSAMKRRRHTVSRFAIAGFTTALFAMVLAGSPRGALSGQADNTSPEITTHDSQPTFALHTQRNEVLVRVVVRDANGRAVTRLQKNDFQIFDNGKPQVITNFSVENSEAAAPVGGTSVPPNPAPELRGEYAPTIPMAHRFMALYFDDVHIEFADLARTRDAADHYLAAEMKPGDRVALFTSSGQNQVDFTDDRAKLRDGLLKLLPRPMAAPTSTQCPQIYPYEAYKISEQRDPIAIQVATQDAIYECCGGPGNPCPQADQNYIETQAGELQRETESETRYALQGLERVCRRMAVLPGQRTIVMVSPGFLVLTENYFLAEVVDQALRQNVVISTLDARGLYVIIPGGDASERGVVNVQNPSLTGYKAQLQSQSKSMNGDVLTAIAHDTGGVAFANSNDYAAGFQRTGGFAGASYLLAFAPENLKADGSMHTLKVTLASNPAQFTLQARKSYFAPQKDEDPATLAADRLEELVFSPRNSQTIPLRVHTQFFKTGSGDARLSIVADVDISHLQFGKGGGRNLNKLTVVSVLFDTAGNYVDGQEEVLDLKLKDATLAKLREAGMNLKIGFTVKPGTYMVREVVQDSEGDQLSALSSQIDIP